MNNCNPYRVALDFNDELFMCSGNLLEPDSVKLMLNWTRDLSKYGVAPFLCDELKDTILERLEEAVMEKAAPNSLMKDLEALFGDDDGEA